MTVAGEGRAPGLEHVHKLGIDHGVDRTHMLMMLEQVLEASLQWKNVASDLDMSSETIKRLESHIERNRMRFCPS